jgi:predicted lysophospholipase L1 biosynthesis ABC-type transport system permease subunit
MVAEVAAVPGITGNPSAMIADLASLSVAMARARPSGLAVSEHWVTVARGAAGTVADEAAAVPGLRVLDRERQAATAGREPYGVGGRSALFAAGLGALLLALIGVAVDVRATARRRVGEFAVLQTMGAGSRLLARSVLAEQAFLAGLGVAVGLAVGVGVAATMAPLVILTPTADRPEPLPVLEVPWLPVAATAGTLFLAAMVLSGAVAATLGRRLAVARLRIGDET